MCCSAIQLLCILCLRIILLSYLELLPLLRLKSDIYVGGNDPQMHLTCPALAEQCIPFVHYIILILPVYDCCMFDTFGTWWHSRNKNSIFLPNCLSYVAIFKAMASLCSLEVPMDVSTPGI